MEVKVNNPWIEIDDIPPIFTRMYKWVVKHPKLVKRWIKTIYHKVFKWDWMLGFFFGMIGGALLTFYCWYYIVTTIYPM